MDESFVIRERIALSRNGVRQLLRGAVAQAGIRAFEQP
jgi:hypothetical protein